MSFLSRREFILLLGGAAAAWPLNARAQPGERMRRIAVVMPFPADNPEVKARMAAFGEGLRQAGWNVGHNIEIAYHWEIADAQRSRSIARELVVLGPDVILATATPAVAALKEVTRTLPIVFVMVADPVSAGLVESLSRPGGNITGFTNFEYGMAAKWLELLKEIAPGVTRVGIIRDPTVTAGIGQFAAIQSIAPTFGVSVSPLGGGDAAAIERTVSEFSRGPNGGLISVAAPLTATHRHRIIALAAQHRLPGIYPFRFFAADGGLISYGPDSVDPYRRAAAYVDRILKGERPADLPVQAPVKYETVINLRTAKALGLEFPPTVLARADEVIE
jgi:putative ABC transport system substrate-binding protein